MPIPHAARKITARFSIRPITAAASARSNTDGPNDAPYGSPSVPARRIIATAPISAASTHATFCVSPTFTPRSDARSARSALARSAMPRFV